MSVLAEEVWQVQNPAVGALLVWRFAIGYSGARSDAAGCPLALAFVVLPTLLHRDTAQHVHTTRRSSGLRSFAAKFSAGGSSESDVLLELNDRARAMRQQSLAAIRMCVGARLLSLDLEEGALFPLTKSSARGVAEEVRSLARGAEKMGRWCAELTLFEVASTLKVRF